jgi:putative spermidine/putrescine transport system substrate-binding protein
MRVVTAALGVLVIALAQACGTSDSGSGSGSGSNQPVTLTFLSFGGALLDAEQKAWLEPFQKAHPNIKIVIDQPTDYAKVKAAVQANNVPWDVIDVSEDFGLKAQEPILEKIDCQVVPCSDLQSKLFPTTGYRVATSQWATALAYNTDAYGSGAAPQSWADFFDLKKFPGKRGVYKDPGGGFLEMALLADGVDAAHLYPLNVDRAFKKWDTIKSQIVWWDTGAQSTQLLRDKEVTMCNCWNGRTWAAQKQGAHIAITWNGNISAGNYSVVPKGTKHRTEAMQLLAYITSPDHNADLAKYISYGPTNIKAISKVDSAIKNDLPSTYKSQGVTIDDFWVDSNRANLEKRFQEWVQS